MKKKKEISYMPFDLEKHIQDHAYIFVKQSNLNKNSIHFNFSFLDLQFLDKDVGKTMSALLAALLVPTSYVVVNGNRKLVDGTPVKKTTERKINLQKDLQAMAVHLIGPEGEDTMPHIHLIADGSIRFGKGFSLLKRHISIISEQFGLIPNFDEMVEHNPLSVKSLSRAVRQITWSLKKSTNAQLEKEIATRGLDKSIALLESYCLKTKNLTYYIKSMEGLKTRLNRMKLNVDYQEHNLRNTYPIPLRKEDMAVIRLIKNKKFTQKAIKPYLKNPILRDFIRHSAGTTKPYIYDALKEQTNLLDHVSKNKQAVDNYKKLMNKVIPQRKSQLTPKDNEKLSRKNELRRIIIEASKSATDEKSFKFIMQKAGYKDFNLKKKRGKVIDCTYKEIEAKRSVPFTDLGIHWEDIKHNFTLNSRKVENMELLPTPTLVKNAPTEKELLTSKKRTKAPKTVPIDYKKEEIKTKKLKAKESSQNRRDNEKIIQSIREEISKFENFITRVKNGISGFRRKINDLTIKIKKFAGYQEEYTHIKEQYSKEETAEITESREIEKVETDINETKQRQSNLTRRFDTAREEEHVYEADIGRIKQEITDRRRENKSLEIEISELETKSTGIVSILTDDSQNGNTPATSSSSPKF